MPQTQTTDDYFSSLTCRLSITERTKKPQRGQRSDHKESGASAYIQENKLLWNQRRKVNHLAMVQIVRLKPPQKFGNKKWLQSRCFYPHRRNKRNVDSCQEIWRETKLLPGWWSGSVYMENKRRQNKSGHCSALLCGLKKQECHTFSPIHSSNFTHCSN